MFGEQFYPTPKEVIAQMLAPYLGEYGKLKDDYRIILEPSAGKGDIIDYLKEVKGYGGRQEIFAFEIDPNLQEIIKSKHARILGDDFLDYTDEKSFDLIVMNPPFKDGVEHLLKAWEIATNTDIVCLLNAESIKNPCNVKRELLAKIIEDNAGEVEFLGSCFDESERKTGVEVVMVRLKKKVDIFSFDLDMEKDFDKITEDDFSEKNLMSFNKIGSVVAQYKESKEIMKRILRDYGKLQKTLSQINDRSSWSLSEILGGYGGAAEKYERFLENVKGGIWHELISLSNIEKYMTTQLRRDFESYVTAQKDIDVTEKNIAKFVEFVLLNRGTILENSIVEVFDELTKYDKENRYFPEGWKTNDNWKVNKKFILSWFGLSWEPRWGGSFSFYGHSEKLSNIDKVMCYISGKDYSKIYSINDAMYKGVRGSRSGEWLDSEFFEFKFYKKGSAHFRFKDEYLWQEFNMRACSLKKWLPKSEEDQWRKESGKMELSLFDK